MPDKIKRIDYYYASVPDKPGEGARILAALRDAGVNLIGVSHSHMAHAGPNWILSRKTVPRSRLRQKPQASS
jgi:ACT domain-containing protein